MNTWRNIQSFKPNLKKLIIAKGISNYSGKRNAIQVGRAVENIVGGFDLVNEGKGLKDITHFEYVFSPNKYNTK